MVLAGDKLLIAGPHGATHNSLAAFLGEEGVSLQVVSTGDGSELASYALDSLPVFDGMAAAGGRLYLALRDGSVVCYAGK